MTSGILNSLNAVLAAVKNIPYEWQDLQYTDRSFKDKLFQKVLVWNDQINREKNGSGYSFQKPACFVEVRHNENEMFSDGVSTSEPIFKFHIVDERLNADDEEGMDENMQAYQYRDALIQAIAGFQPPQCSTLFKVGEEQDYMHDDVYHYCVDMKCRFTDTKGSNLDPDQTTVTFYTPPPDLPIELTVEFETES